LAPPPRPPGPPAPPAGGHAAPYLRALRPPDGLSTLLEEAARRRLDALTLAAVGTPRAALEAGELLALARHRRPRLVPSEEPPAAAVAERIVQLAAAALRELGQRLRERLAAEA
jgi:hypothetical protein